MQQELIDFIHAHPVAHLATVADGAPRVRAMVPFHVDASGIYVGTLESKALYAQLQAHPYIELCFVDLHQNRQLRISGKVRELPDLNHKEAMVETFAFMHPVVEEYGWDMVRTFHLAHGHFAWWDRDTGFTPLEWVEF